MSSPSTALSLITPVSPETGLSSLSILGSALNIVASASSVAAISAASTAAASPPGLVSTTSSVGASTISTSALARDLVDLLKNLAMGDLVAAQADLSKLKMDMKAENITITYPAPVGTLSHLVSQVSDSLDAGSTDGALMNLATYLIQNGKGIGNLVNVYS